MFIAGSILVLAIVGFFLFRQMASPPFIAGMISFVFKEIFKALKPSWKKIKDSKTPEEWEALRKKVAEDNRGDK